VLLIRAQMLRSEAPVALARPGFSVCEVPGLKARRGVPATV